MLLLTKGDHAAFHTVLEGLEMESALKESSASTKSAGSGIKGKAGHRRDSMDRAVLEGDAFLKYPVMLEQWLMEGAYDRVWTAVKKDGVPSEEFAVFSGVCHPISIPQSISLLIQTSDSGTYNPPRHSNLF